jgi:hypothetical protein
MEDGEKEKGKKIKDGMHFLSNMVSSIYPPLQL